MNKRNTAWTITASAPLLRPGMSISITVSEKYVVEEALKLIAKVREINVAAQHGVEPTEGSLGDVSDNFVVGGSR